MYDIHDYTFAKMVKRKNTITFNESPPKRGRYQRGYGPVKFNVYRTYNPVNRQRGHGIGGLLRGAFRRAIPFIKKVLPMQDEEHCVQVVMFSRMFW